MGRLCVRRERDGDAAAPSPSLPADAAADPSEEGAPEEGGGEEGAKAGREGEARPA